MEEQKVVAIPDLPEWYSNTPREPLMEEIRERTQERLKRDGDPVYEYKLIIHDQAECSHAEDLTMTRAEYIQLKRHLVRIRVAAALRDTAEAIEDGQAEPGEAVSLLRPGSTGYIRNRRRRTARGRAMHLRSRRRQASPRLPAMGCARRQL